MQIPFLQKRVNHRKNFTHSIIERQVKTVFAGVQIFNRNTLVMTLKKIQISNKILFGSKISDFGKVWFRLITYCMIKRQNHSLTCPIPVVFYRKTIRKKLTIFVQIGSQLFVLKKIGNQLLFRVGNYRIF